MKERKIRPNECPYELFISNHKNELKNGLTNICMKKWYFNLSVETFLAKNSLTLKYLFYQVDKIFSKFIYNFKIIKNL
jgi:hypothetical protein